jgi:assimilatory nitrate reductase catalytic subunit
VRRDFIRAHTEGFDALKRSRARLHAGMAADICGVKAEDIVTAARWFGQAPAALSSIARGSTSPATAPTTMPRIIHLHLATGKIGKPGCGPFSLTGQPNAMGGREVGGMANLLPAHRDLANPEHRAEVARLWGVPRCRRKPGLTAVELFEAVHAARSRRCGSPAPTRRSRCPT